MSDQFEYGKAFEKFFDDVRLSGVLSERERIIALLDDPMWHHIAYVPIVAGDKPTTYHDGECLGCRQIALIKGENK